MAARLNRKAMVDALYLHNDIANKAAAGRVIDAFIEYIQSEVTAGNTVALSGFGKFEAFKCQNGTVLPKFRPFSEFKQSLR